MKLYEFMNDLQKRSHAQCGIKGDHNVNRSEISISVPGIIKAHKIDASDVISERLGNLTVATRGATIIMLDGDHDLHVELGSGVTLKNVNMIKYSMNSVTQEVWGEFVKKAERKGIWIVNSRGFPAGLQLLKGKEIPQDISEMSGDLALDRTKDIFAFTQRTQGRITRVFRYLGLKELEEVIED